MIRNATGGAVWIQEMENGRKIRYIQNESGRWVQFQEEAFQNESKSCQSDEPIPMHHLLNFVS